MLTQNPIRPAAAVALNAAMLATTRRLANAKRAYTTRHVPLESMAGLLEGSQLVPRAGDLVLARVQRVGKHAALELTESRRATMFVGDEVLVAYAARYAPDQFLAEVPANLGPCHLAASGGVAATVTSRHGGVAAPTELLPLGLLVDAHGERMNVSNFALPRGKSNGARPLTIASLGTSMNAGKTTSAAYLISGLVAAGLRVGGAKITGTGSGNDSNLLRDAGAALVLDFTDAGHTSTFGLDLPALEGILDAIQTRMQAERVDVLVMEIADGLLQRETEMLLRSPYAQQRIDGCIFSSGEAMGAIAGVQWLQAQQLPVLTLAGTITRSPLARAEAEQATGLGAMGLDELSHPDAARQLAGRAKQASRDRNLA
jgi:hypothetical protein